MHRSPLALLLASLLFTAASLVHAQDLATIETSDWGTVLTNADGMSLYLYVEDVDGELGCVGACTNNWPPLLVEGEPDLGDDLDDALVATVERPDGAQQLTYGGHPLYTYARDREPGDTNGQALGDAFFLVSTDGTASTDRTALARVEMDDDLFAALMTEGEGGYASQCAMCHADDGAGRIGPSLQTNDLLGDTEFLIGRILNGFEAHGMPAFRDQLTDREIAAIATFVRNSWGNDFGGVFEEGVSELR